MNYENFPERLGQTISDLRAESGLTQTELADKIGVDSNYISMLERGKRLPSTQFLINISDVLDCPLHIIFLKAEGNTSGLYYLAKILEKVDFDKLSESAEKLMNALEES